VLLIRHKRLDAWLPVGGEIHPGETPLEAARRELFEETSLEGCFDYRLGISGTPPGFIAYEEHIAGSKGLHMNFVFVASVSTDTIVPNAEFTDFRWVRDPDAVPCLPNVRALARLALEVSR
jgi:8-oxo-dGTP pyrophosphatase MutT (NUDIX family)